MLVLIQKPHPNSIALFPQEGHLEHSSPSMESQCHVSLASLAAHIPISTPGPLVLLIGLQFDVASGALLLAC